MNIGLTTLAYYTYELHHGLSNTVNLTTKYLRKRGVDVTIHTTRVKGQPESEEFMGIQIRRFPFVRFLREWTVSPLLMDYLKRGGFDIIHSFYYGYFPTQAGFWAAGSLGVPYIMTPSYQNLQFSAVKTSLRGLSVSFPRTGMRRGSCARLLISGASSCLAL
jgi:hypothetical protein